MKNKMRKLEKYGGLYSINSGGYILGHRFGQYLKMYLSNGEVVVRLLGKNVSVALLVAETFIPRPKGNFLVRHKDGDLMNNCVDNLEWYQEENKIPYHILERKTKERRLRGKKATYNLRKRIEVQERNSRGYFRIIDVVLGINNTAKKYGVPRSAIYKCCKHAKIKAEYERRPWMFGYEDDRTRKRKEKLYKRDKIYKNRYKFRELSY